MSNFVPIHAKEIQIGDVIQQRFNSFMAYSACTVFNIEGDNVYVRRPFCYSKGCSSDVEFKVSYEEYSFSRNPSTTECQYLLLERSK